MTRIVTSIVSEPMQVRRQWKVIFKVWKEQNSKLKLNTYKTTYKFEGKLQIFQANKTHFRPTWFISNVKEVFQAEGTRYQMEMNKEIKRARNGKYVDK